MNDVMWPQGLREESRRRVRFQHQAQFESSAKHANRCGPSHMMTDHSHRHIPHELWRHSANIYNIHGVCIVQQSARYDHSTLAQRPMSPCLEQNLHDNSPHAGTFEYHIPWVSLKPRSKEMSYHGKYTLQIRTQTQYIRNQEIQAKNG